MHDEEKKGVKPQVMGSVEILEGQWQSWACARQENDVKRLHTDC